MDSFKNDLRIHKCINGWISMKLKKIQVNRQFVFCIFVFLYICVDCMVLFRQSKLRYVAILLSLCGMIIFAGRIKISFTIKEILSLYILLLFTTILGSISQHDSYGIVQSFKVILHVLVLVLILMVSKKNYDKIIEYFMKIYLFISVLISIQCIILFFFVWFGRGEGTRIYYESLDTFKISFGILGFGDAINYFGKAAFLRTSGFFREPTKLGAFLILPICWGYVQYQKTKKKQYLLYELLMCFNFLATFSRACFLAFAISLTCTFLFQTKSDKRNYHVSFNKKLRATVLITCCAIGFFLLGNFLYQYRQTEDEMYSNSSVYENNVIKGMMNRSSTVESKYNNAFIRDNSSFEQIFLKVKEEPFGYGLGWSGRKQEFNNPTALGFWIYSGGVLALIVLVLLYGWLFYHYYLECMYSGNIQLKVFGIAFLSLTIQNMSYGSWQEPLYMLVVALMVLIVEKKKNEKYERLKRNALYCTEG